MGTAFRDKIREWADAADLTPTVIQLYFKPHGGKEQAYLNARKITKGLASLRQWERHVSDKRQAAREEPRLRVTPYEDVICTIFNFEDRYEVRFFPRDADMFEELFVEKIGVDNGEVKD